MKEDMDQERLETAFAKAGGLDAGKHVFVCIGPECCSGAEGEALWEVIKKRVRETGVKAMRTKAGCFRVCVGGPLLVVYPEGTWYGQVTEARFERILEQHLLGGTPVKEWVWAENGLAVEGCSRLERN